MYIKSTRLASAAIEKKLSCPIFFIINENLLQIDHLDMYLHLDMQWLHKYRDFLLI